MRVLLINPSVGYYTRALSNPLGLISIGTYLRQAGHEVRLYDRCVEKTKTGQVLKVFSPDVVGISVMSSRGLKDAVKVSRQLKQRGITVVWGGQLPSLQLDLVLENEFVDMVSFGEGEETWLELLQRLSEKGSLSEVRGIAYKENGKIIRNPCRDFSDLGKMPVFDWSLIDVPKYMQTYLGCRRMMYIYSSKGCPCRCAFCSNVNFHKSTHRKRPNALVIQDIKYLIENFGLDGVFFSDELWCLKRSEMQDFCARVQEEKLQFRWGVQLRIGMFDEEDYQLMYDAGCRWVFFGIESGSKEMLQAIHKNIDFDKIKPTFDFLKKIGYTTIGSFIVGFPDETAEQLRETTRLINDIDASLTPIYHFTPLPGTELYDRLVAEGRYREPKTLKELYHVVATESIGVNFSRVPDRDLKVIRSWYHWKGFSDKDALENEKPFEFAKQTVLSGLHVISLKGIFSFFVNGMTALHEFLYVYYYSHRYPEIVKKYGLR